MITPSYHDYTEKLIVKYEHYVAPFTFLLGFVFDTITLRRIDLWLDHVILLGYLLVAGAGIIVFNAYESGRFRFRPLAKIMPFVPVFIQFGFGGLFSAFLIFYTRSGAVSKSWLFLLALFFLTVGNERFRLRYQRFIFQVSIYFTALFSYAIFALPLIFKKIGDLMFLASGILSLLLVAVFIFFIKKVFPQEVEDTKETLAISIGGIYLLFNILYFTNIIPPIPLALKESGIYHSIISQNGRYVVTFEKPKWYNFFEETNPVYHWQSGARVYAYSAIFAPAKISTTIFHHWYYYSEIKSEWIDHGSSQFSIVGGRDGGYRGYSYKTGILPGKWRIDVTNERGQILGRQKFTVVETQEKILLESAIR